MGQVASIRYRLAVNRSVLVLLCAATACLLTADVSFAEGLESYRLATGYYQRSKWALSVEEFRTFLKDMPDHPKAEKAKVFLGMALVNLKEFKEAREVFRAFIAKHQDSRYLSHAMYRTGECSFLLDDLRQRKRNWRRFCKSFPTIPSLPAPTYNQAETNWRLAKPEQAAELFQKIVANERRPDAGQPSQIRPGQGVRPIEKN